jgi:hypothetical protein
MPVSQGLTVEVESVLGQVTAQRNAALDDVAKAQAAIGQLQQQLELKDAEIGRLNRLLAEADHVGDSGSQ